MTAASAPPAAVLERMEALGIEVTHVYGLTEVYGPATVCAWQESWDELDAEHRSRKLARQGVPYPVLEGLDVDGPGDDDAGPARRRDDRRDHDARPRRDEGLPQEPDRHRARPSPAAGSTPAISPSCTPTAMSRSRTARKTSSSPAARTSARSRSRARSTAIPPCSRPRWWPGPTRNGARARAPSSPCGRGRASRAEELIEHCRSELARFKAPRTIVFGPLPKTSTGKIQKFQLREQAKQL